MRDKIEKFEMLSTKGSCMITSGKCGQQHYRVVREVVTKKMSSEKKFGDGRGNHPCVSNGSAEQYKQ